MRAFVGVVEAGSMSAAARRSAISQSTLSQTISSLERRLGTQLLVRTRFGVHPTQAGRTMLAEARAVLDRHARALTSLARRIDGEQDALRLGLVLELPPGLLTEPLAALRSAFPGGRVVTSHLPQEAQEYGLRTGDLDLGLVYGRPAGADLDGMLVLEEPLGVLFSARHAAHLAGKDGVRLEALDGLEWVAFPRQEAPGFYDEAASALRNHGLSVAEPELDSRFLIPEVRYTTLALGRGFGLAPERVLRQMPGSLAWYPLAGDPIVRRTWAVWPAASRRRDVGRLVASLGAPSCSEDPHHVSQDVVAGHIDLV